VSDQESSDNKALTWVFTPAAPCMPLNKCTFCGRCPLRPIILFLQRPSLRAKALRSRTLGYRLAVSFQGHHPPQTDITSTSSRGDMSRRFLGQPPFHSPLPHCGVRALSPVGETRYHPHNTLYFHVSVSEWPVAFLSLFISYCSHGIVS
jgi:hypothetical protein